MQQQNKTISGTNFDSIANNKPLVNSTFIHVIQEV